MRHDGGDIGEDVFRTYGGAERSAAAILKVGILRLFMGCLGFLRVQAGLSMS